MTRIFLARKTPKTFNNSQKPQDGLRSRRMSMKCKKLDLSLILTSDMDTWASKKDYFVESFDEMVSHLKSEMDELKSTEDFLNIFDGKGKDIVEDCSRPADSQQIIMYLYLCHLKKKFNQGWKENTYK
jgi:hypothetical protein